VLQIVRSLGGKIDIQSRQGVGTEAKVSLELRGVSVLPPPLGHYDNSLNVREKTKRTDLVLVGFHTGPDASSLPMETRNAEPEPLLSLQASIERMATHWFGMKVTTSLSQDSSPPDVY
jgi:hypothetical protein